MDKRKALFSGRTMVVVVVLAAVVLAAVGCWVAQQMYGLGITGMNNSNSWGLYIMAFMFFVGLSAGGLIVASSAHVFGIESFKRVSVPAVITSIVCICCAGAFVLIDLGGVARVWRMFVGLNFVSPLAWDMIVITCYLVINPLVHVKHLRARALFLEQHMTATTPKPRHCRIRIIQVAEHASITRAAMHAHRLVAAIGTLLAQAAFLGHAAWANRHAGIAIVETCRAHRLVPVEHASVIRTGAHAHTTADAAVVINLHATLLIFVCGAGRAHLHTCRILAVLASNRQIRTRKVGVRANSVVEHLRALGEHAVPQHAIRDVVLHLASDRARVRHRVV